MPRKHFYLIVEHENDDRVGGVSIHGTRRTRPLKNEVAPVTIYDDAEGDFRDVGQMVGLGYADFQTEEVYEETVGDVVKEKVREVDREWAAKAGVEETIYNT